MNMNNLDTSTENMNMNNLDTSPNLSVRMSKAISPFRELVQTI